MSRACPNTIEDIQAWFILVTVIVTESSMIYSFTCCKGNAEKYYLLIIFHMTICCTS